MEQIDALYEWCWRKSRRRTEFRSVRHYRDKAMKEGPKFDAQGNPIPLPKPPPRKAKAACFKLPEAPARYVVDEKIFDAGEYKPTDPSAPGALEVPAVR